jgi:solute carrier family 12 sodium/potassium/chloride transporter 2
VFGTLIIALACTVTTMTAISMCTICTNGYVKGGGLYFLISRSLGAEIGGAIGMIFALANAIAAAMYIVGFAETICDLMKDNEMAIFDNGLNDIRVIGLGKKYHFLLHSPKFRCINCSVFFSHLLHSDGHSFDWDEF